MPSEVLRRAPKSPALDSRAVRVAANRMLRALELERAELSVLLTSDDHIQELNRVHRGKDSPTDVLAFALEEADSTRVELPVRVLGDVVISLDTAARQAARRRHELRDEVLFLLAHGLLHLVGYDHRTDQEEAVMNAETRRLVAAAAQPARDARRTRARRANPGRRPAPGRR